MLHYSQFGYTERVAIGFAVPNVKISKDLSGSDDRKAPSDSNGVTQCRLGSPFWCGLGSQSRTFEFPERDIPTTSSSKPANGTQSAPTYKHVTNLLIDKVRNSSS